MAVKQCHGEKSRFRIRSVQMDNPRGVLGIIRMDRVPNAWIRELCGVAKGANEKIYESAPRWFSHIERMENDRIPKKMYVGESVSS